MNKLIDKYLCEGKCMSIPNNRSMNHTTYMYTSEFMSYIVNKMIYCRRQYIITVVLYST